MAEGVQGVVEVTESCGQGQVCNNLIVLGHRKEKMKADEMRGDIENEPRKV